MADSIWAAPVRDRNPIARRDVPGVGPPRMPGVPLLANTTEFGRPPFFTAAEFNQMGYKMVIWPISALRVAARAQEQFYAALKADGGAHAFLDRMQTRAELYATIGYAEYEALDRSIVATVVPEGMPQTVSRAGDPT